MIAAKQWPADKPLPDPEQFVMRDLLESTLKEMNYVPTKLDAPTQLTSDSVDACRRRSGGSMRTIRCGSLAARLRPRPASVAFVSAPPRRRPRSRSARSLSGNGFHIPSYVAMDQGFYKAEGLDASFVALAGQGAGHRRRSPAASTSSRSRPAARRRR